MLEVVADKQTDIYVGILIYRFEYRAINTQDPVVREVQNKE